MRVRFLIISVLAVPGCGADELQSPTAAKLRGLGALYLDCAVSRDGKGPTSEQDFKKHLHRVREDVLSANGMSRETIDAAFVSERDQEPFVVRYGLKITRVSGKSAALVAHEKTGKNGKRLVGFANGKVALVDDAQLQELITVKE